MTKRYFYVDLMSLPGSVVKQLMDSYKVTVLRVVLIYRIEPIIISLQLILRHKPQISSFYASNGSPTNAFMCEAR
jgi:hypothetical protein